MTTPSKTLFDDWLVLSNTAFAKGKDEAIQVAHRNNNFSKSSDLIEEFVDRYLKESDSHWERLQRHPVKQWLDAQPGYKRAIALFENKRKSPSFPTQNSRERLISYLIEGVDPGQIAARAGYVSVRTYRRTWLTQVVQALQNYVFDDHDAVHLARTRLKKNVEQIIKLVEEVVPYLDTTTSAATSQLILRRVSAWNRHVDLRPVRDLKTKAEIAFVSQMYRANRTIARSSKPAVIAELMTLECFSRQFDERHIARICSALEETKKKASEINKLLTLLDG